MDENIFLCYRNGRNFSRWQIISDQFIFTVFGVAQHTMVGSWDTHSIVYSLQNFQAIIMPLYNCISNTTDKIFKTKNELLDLNLSNLLIPSYLLVSIVIRLIKRYKKATKIFYLVQMKTIWIATALVTRLRCTTNKKLLTNKGQRKGQRKVKRDQRTPKFKGQNTVQRAV